MRRRMSFESTKLIASSQDDVNVEYESSSGTRDCVPGRRNRMGASEEMIWCGGFGGWLYDFEQLSGAETSERTFA